MCTFKEFQERVSMFSIELIYAKWSCIKVTDIDKLEEKIAKIYREMNEKGTMRIRVVFGKRGEPISSVRICTTRLYLKDKIREWDKDAVGLLEYNDGLGTVDIIVIGGIVDENRVARTIEKFIYIAKGIYDTGLIKVGIKHVTIRDRTFIPILIGHIITS